jgi:hypothetical protein
VQPFPGREVLAARRIGNARRPSGRDERVPELVALQWARLQELLTEAVDPRP